MNQEGAKAFKDAGGLDIFKPDSGDAKEVKQEREPKPKRTPKPKSEWEIMKDKLKVAARKLTDLRQDVKVWSQQLLDSTIAPPTYVDGQVKELEGWAIVFNGLHTEVTEMMFPKGGTASEEKVSELLDRVESKRGLYGDVIKMVKRVAAAPKAKAKSKAKAAPQKPE
jgi:hypothetical protein